MELGRIYVYPLIVPREEGVETISLNWIAAMLDPTVVSRIHAKGYDAVVWTTDSPAVMQIMAWLGADGISTNRPDKPDLRMGGVMD
jgi:glycerophosphoryl diester phosphodiesterase